MYRKLLFILVMVASYVALDIYMDVKFQRTLRTYVESGDVYLTGPGRFEAKIKLEK